VSDFVAVTETIGPVARAPRLRQVAPELRPPLARATALARRLDAARLEDARLEEQRRLAVAALGQVVQAMQQTSAAAEAANPVRLVAAVEDLDAAVAELRDLPESSESPTETSPG
jgi:hypothetical protein